MSERPDKEESKRSIISKTDKLHMRSKIQDAVRRVRGDRKADDQAAKPGEAPEYLSVMHDMPKSGTPLSM